ncbi:hypothetical protein ASC76_11965 [Rhizobacter sp. Root404]|nr:hypothetical protein ASC76_11965 [Rhizobacter sp. Root404]
MRGAAGVETIMANDADWVADVRRWYFSGQGRAAVQPAAADDDTTDIGYEAAHPALQSHHWPDAPRTGFADFS